MAESGAEDAAGRLDNGVLNDPRLDLCTNTDDELTAFAWVEPQPDAKWVVVSDAGNREVYEVAESLPVRVTTTDGTTLEGASRVFSTSRNTRPTEASSGSTRSDAQVAG